MKEQKEITAKFVAEVHRNIDIAKEHGMSVTHILSHDLLPVSWLFDGDLPAHVSKSKLVEEIEAGLTKWGRPSGYTTHAIVDFMFKIHRMPLARFPTLGSVIQATINSVLSLCKHANHIHVLDSYIEMSLKNENVCDV